jgi:hypothetical protein
MNFTKGDTNKTTGALSPTWKENQLSMPSPIDELKSHVDDHIYLAGSTHSRANNAHNDELLNTI